ncbi:GNAT family N-acetyltransferase [Roseinatronobacter alkalisoli]|uniref:L-ornithine N(alpha)-acyltransferase n=1 Tax=Roseinatronobacter alkalisoli TaxID=3028235 RepID=A0ABT5T4Y5_9RHOB|nr:GNAT family N-acyltransferase [Roseinatronobacter sp. HJB301]MDD7970183.1 GNAT family N-acetyltransferase [Roseinatronobacter sp. HJB301]
MNVDQSRLAVRLARDDADIRAAQHLRYRVFIEELGGEGLLVDHANRLECDELDPYFDHLLLVDTRLNPDDCQHVVGAYRLLPDDRLAQTGRFYCDREFDLRPLRESGRRLLELGRSCVDTAYRGGPGMLLMWQALAEYVRRHDHDILFGAASFHGTDPQALAQPLSLLHQQYLAPPALRVRARTYQSMDLVPPDRLDRKVALAQVPSLIKAYLRIGGVIGDGAFIDHDFRTTDICLILDTHAMTRAAYGLTTKGHSAP